MALALLTPVPLPHLISGVEVCHRVGRVAYGSQAWEVFRELDGSAGPGVPVLIYASHTDAPLTMRVTWTARYMRYVESKGGVHPEGTAIRPHSTILGGEDRERYWAGFYEVEDLRRLDDTEQINIADLSKQNGQRYGHAFVPERPIIIAAPTAMDRQRERS